MPVENKLKEFQNMEREIEALKSDKARTEGGLEATQTQLKEKYNCTVTTIDKAIKDEMKNQQQLDKQFTEMFEQLKSDYDWNNL